MLKERVFQGLFALSAGFSIFAVGVIAIFLFFNAKVFATHSNKPATSEVNGEITSILNEFFSSRTIVAFML